MSMFDGQQKEDPPDRDDMGRFAAGNKLWREAIAKAGAPRIFDTPQDLLAAALEYFEWADANPQYIAKGFGTGLIMKLPHPIPLTIRGLCSFHGFTERTWRNYSDRDEFQDVCELIEATMVDQRYAGASVGMFNANLIARDLGLADNVNTKSEMTVEIVDHFDGQADGETSDTE